ncbi:hypothetical protein MVES1_003199 [Malassezia vespertilionis]|uniref:uncharacterized protein n=1 Tax=Malassezia vespertilionis TaxID=2020962 RepID=UPI0024B16FC3|nr:uncharacterized protein MVES1_003199 [Malassezia vespertilionis]WFD07828.1 hypothetical protein MVES1_003199 [Malassezia vespertilionis]
MATRIAGLVLSTDMSTQDLQWLLIRKTNSNIVKQKGLGRVFTRETGNVSALHNYKVRDAKCA